MARKTKKGGSARASRAIMLGHVRTMQAPPYPDEYHDCTREPRTGLHGDEGMMKQDVENGWLL